MTLVGQDVLSRAARRNIPLRKWLTTWATAVENLEWRSLDDVRKSYPTADGVRVKSKVVVTVFNIKGNEYRLIASIDYDSHIVEVLEVLTHAEYDKEMWKGRY